MHCRILHKKAEINSIVITWLMFSFYSSSSKCLIIKWQLYTVNNKHEKEIAVIFIFNNYLFV